MNVSWLRRAIFGVIPAVVSNVWIFFQRTTLLMRFTSDSIDKMKSTASSGDGKPGEPVRAAVTDQQQFLHFHFVQKPAGNNATQGIQILMLMKFTCNFYLFTTQWPDKFLFFS
ncbi:hypothetical protein IZS90_004592 [Escherichia coli]|uniref:hypothetical protein n=1 Tax=Escherichia coli TaxID=562 RepID=UPI0016B45673|nr:hypothetical protein [Escherichia coli]EFJ1988249.1 hypothetical protein [Escherichia coli]EFL9576180.1 hypothetical protein [Escherichia coli]EFO6492427.1 hypothetical protein [Escherichia coli]EFT1906841.1 hypothetical protein [Escherichia coli]EGP4635496.1 hypothetical protein [Escherichia coli]